MTFQVKFTVFNKKMVKEIEAESFHAAQTKFLEEFKSQFSIDLVEPVASKLDPDDLSIVDDLFRQTFGHTWKTKPNF